MSDSSVYIVVCVCCDEKKEGRTLVSSIKKKGKILKREKEPTWAPPVSLNCTLREREREARAEEKRPADERNWEGAPSRRPEEMPSWTLLRKREEGDDIRRFSFFCPDGDREPQNRQHIHHCIPFSRSV